jgi:hypothetical protein
MRKNVTVVKSVEIEPSKRWKGCEQLPRFIYEHNKLEIQTWQKRLAVFVS